MKSQVYFVSLAIALALVVTPASAPARQIDRLFLSVETIGHIPKTLDRLTDNTERLSLSALKPILHETGIIYGVGVTELSSQIVMRIAYRFASGNFPPDSFIGNAGVSRYALSGVPLSVGWRMTFLPYRVRALLGVDAGGAFTHMRYERIDAGPVDSGWAWAWEIRGIGGVHVDIWQWLSARVFVEGRYGRAVVVTQGPEYSPSGLGIGIAIAATFDRPKAKALAAKPIDTGDDDDSLREYSSLGASRIDHAFEVIRQADEAVKRRDFIDAEALYRRGVHLLPRDEETRRNVEVPVRVDWARCLIDVGRTDEAIRALDEALSIDPNHPAARRLRSSL